MIELKMPQGKQECLVYSLAMVLELNPDDVLKEFPLYYQRQGGGIRGIHVQELMDYLLASARALTIIERDPQFEGIYPVYDLSSRFQDQIDNSEGILIGLLPNGRCHAIANSFGKQIDPKIIPMEINVYQYWRIDRIRSTSSPI